MMNIIGFEATTFAMWKLYRYFEDSYTRLKNTLGDGVDGAELRILEIERMFDQVDDDNERIDKLRDYTRGFHSGLILNGGFVEEEVLGFLETVSCDMLGEIFAANFRRSLEDMRTMEGRYRGRKVMLKAALEDSHRRPIDKKIHTRK